MPSPAPTPPLIVAEISGNHNGSIQEQYDNAYAQCMSSYGNQVMVPQVLVQPQPYIVQPAPYYAPAPSPYYNQGY